MHQQPSIVVITGASAGIGRATALAFARRGCKLGLIARSDEGLEEAKREVEQAGGEALALPLDVADHQAVAAAAERVEQELGPIDVWVNCAMVTVLGRVTATSAEEFRRVTDVTYLGYVHGTLAALEHMQRRDRGTIVQVGSALAYRSIPLQSAYCAAKAAIRGFTDSLRSELIHDGSQIRLTMVQLPAHNTPQFNWARNHMPARPRPVAPVYKPEVAAHAIVRAAIEAPRELWVGKSAVQAIVGTMVAPGLLDRMMAKKAFSGQYDDEPAQVREDNLEDAPHMPHTTHGRFGDEAKPWALELPTGNLNQVLLGAAGLAVLAASVASAVGTGMARGSIKGSQRISRH